MARIFISYSRRDEVLARRLAGSLSQMGADIWLDVDDIPVGMNWSSAIQQGLDTCDLMILILSPDSMASHNVANEWQFYLDHRKLLVPVLARPTQVHFQLNRIQYVDFHAQPYELALGQLVTKLAQQGVRLNVPPELRNIPLPATPHTYTVPKARGGGAARGLLIAGGLATMGAVAVLALIVLALLPTLSTGNRDTTTPIPTTPANTDVPQPPTFDPILGLATARANSYPPGPDYIAQREWAFSSYLVQLWQDSVTQEVALTIDSPNQPHIEHKSYFANPEFNNLIGADLNGDGYPDVVFEQNPGGATGSNCITVFYSLAPTIIKALEPRTSVSCGSQFTDLDGDGVSEFTAYDDTFKYQFCSGAASPSPQAILRYDPDRQQYLPAGSRYPSLYDSAITQLGMTRETVQATYNAGDTETAKCLALAPVLNYLYSGREDRAWSELERLYPFPDLEEFRTTIVTIAASSDLYRRP